MNKIIIYTDGGAIDNPGPAAIGVVIRISPELSTNKNEYIANKKKFGKNSISFGKNSSEKRYSEYIGQATNNQAEYQALIFGLKKVKSLFGKKKAKNLEVECYLDSELLTKQLQGKYKILEKDLRPLFIEVWNLKTDFQNVSFNYTHTFIKKYEEIEKKEIKERN